MILDHIFVLDKSNPVLDTLVLDTFALDALVLDALVLDTFIPDTFVLDTLVLDACNGTRVYLFIWSWGCDWYSYIDRDHD